MRILLEATNAITVTEDGDTTVRLWRGFTEDGAPILAAVVGIAASAGTVTDPALQGAAQAPVRNCGADGCTVLRTWDGQVTYGRWWI